MTDDAKFAPGGVVKAPDELNETIVEWYVSNTNGPYRVLTRGRSHRILHARELERYDRQQLSEDVEDELSPSAVATVEPTPVAVGCTRRVLEPVSRYIYLRRGRIATIALTCIVIEQIARAVS